ncbi:MAG: RNA polymerase sporulation sigma factor SigG [Anaerotruncus massiliensis (ex Togo et al. 2019)]
MYYNKVEICGINTAKLTVLKEKEKIELLKRIRQGDQQARQEMINGNLRLVLSVVQKFTNRGENLDDLFQVGCIGLIKAIDNFDPNQNVRFSTYGVPMIIGEIRRHLRDNNSVRVSRSLRDLAYKAMQAKETLINQLQGPTVDEIAAEMGAKKEDVARARGDRRADVPLRAGLFDGGDTIYVMDQVGDKGGESDWMDEIAIKEAMKSLGDREKRILTLRFFVGKTQMEVAKEIGISQAQVSRLEKGALDWIKKHI